MSQVLSNSIEGCSPHYTLLATTVYFYVCVKHINNELQDINVNMLYSV